MTAGTVLSPSPTRPATGNRVGLSFVLPAELAAGEPIEAAGARPAVRMIVSDGDEAPSSHRFDELPSVLRPGDLLVVNTSATMAAAIDGRSETGDGVVVHISTELPTGIWLVEVRRRLDGGSTEPDPFDRAGQSIAIEGGATVALLGRFSESERLWIATVTLPGGIGMADHLARHGRPIRYPYVTRDWPLDAYQTVFGRHQGSAEMPSASRPFTESIVTDLVASGVGIAPLTLHTGVSSLESHERPYPERFEVPASTARLINHTRDDDGRVIAIGTTVVRALESVVDDHGLVHPGDGWTDVLVTPERGVSSIDGLLTGWHEPEASHLLMLEAVARPGSLVPAYAAALEGRYLWHEFGDVHLILR